MHVITVKLADLKGDRSRAPLLQVPTALSIGGGEVARLIEAKRHLQRMSPEFRELQVAERLTHLLASATDVHMVD